MNRNLVYFCLFYNKDYVDLLRILMITVKFYSQTDTIDFLVLTESKFESVIKDISTMLNIPILTKIYNPLTDFLDSCCARYSIFDYEHINNYQKILYLDADIVVQNDLTTLFTIDIEDRVYAVPEGTIQFSSWGGTFFDFTKIDKNLKGMNAGTLLFKNIESIRTLFKDITEHITCMKKNGCLMPHAAEQPFLNFHSIKNALYDNTLMDKYGCIYGNKSIALPSNPTDVILCHYIGVIKIKKNAMLKHVTHLLDNYKKLLKQHKPFVVPNIIGNVYTWGNTRFTFIDNATFVTSWATYNYIWLDEFTLEANWSKYSHIFRFNSDYTSYISVRKHTLDYGWGSLYVSPINRDSDTIVPAVAFAAVNDSTKHPAPIKSMNSNLVYFCIFHNNDYVDLLRILMKTVKLYSQTDTIDFLVITESKFESAIKHISTMLNIPIHIKICNTLNKYDTYYSRYSIFDYEHINNYKKILYLDTDIIIQNDLITLFNIDIEDRIHGMPELNNENKHFTIESEWFGGWFFDFTTIDKNIKGMNSGILFFKNTESSRLIFKDITEHIAFMKKLGCRMPVPWDQPFLNFHCIKRNRHDTTLMNKYGFIYFRNSPPPPSSPTDIILCHYAGETESKKNKMLKHVLHLLNNYKNLLKQHKPFIVPNITGNVYTWGNTRFTFIDNATFVTSWATYNYIWLDEFTLEANWSKYSHIFRFNSDYTSYISVRKDNLDYGTGSLTISTIDMNFLNNLINNRFTMVPMKRLLNLYNNCSLFTNKSYSFVECGVAKGGCIALMKKLAGPKNKVFGFDSFEGMPAITQDDISDYNKGNPSEWVGNNLSGGIENVYKTFQALQLDMTNVHLIKGLFQDTLVQQEIIDKIGPIAVLRLDGDWYESIKVCLETLYDKVVVGGVIILDDYGHWVGNKKATDEFRQKRNILSPLIQTDYSEYYWIKQDTPYDLCELAKKYCVDKCPAFMRHTYTPEYHKLLNTKRNEIQLVCEIGIGNVPLMAPVTSSNYKPGASLRMWRDYFPRAQIVGCDILESVLFTEERITTFQTDQSSVESLNRLSNNIRKLNPYADIILDDGSHKEEHMVTSFKTLWSLVKPNGFYIIEDIHISFLDRIANLNKEFDFKDAKCLHVHKGNIEKFPMDNFVVFSKIIEFENRNDMLTYYSNTIDKPKILEIGIFKGEFFDFIANNCSIGLLDGVDLFVGTDGSGDQDGNNFIWYNLEKSFKELTEKYKNNPNVNLHKSDSSTYLKSKMDDYYDIIYIDADHTYEGCKRDLTEAFKKIKQGGYIMGHDYEMNMKKGKTDWKCGVPQAVNEFCDTYNQSIIAKAMDGCVGFCIRIDKTAVPLAAGKI